MTHGVPSASTAAADLLLGVAEAVVAGRQAELLGDEPADALAVHRQPRGARRRHDVQPLRLELEQHRRGDRLELGHDEQLRARPRALGVQHVAQRVGIGHVDHGVALRDLHRGRARVAVDRQHLAAEPQRLDRHLTTELAAAQQHEAHGGVGQRWSRGEAHGCGSLCIDDRPGGDTSPMDPTESHVLNIARVVEGDWALHRIAWLADQGFSISITLITDAGVFAGETAKGEAFAQSADELLAGVLASSEATLAKEAPTDLADLAGFAGMTSGDFALLKQQFEQGVMFSPVFKARREHERKMRERVREHERNETPVDDVPEDVIDWLRIRDRPVPVLTLTDARWTSAMGGPLDLPSPVRVMTSKVTAWWLGRALDPAAG